MPALGLGRVDLTLPDADALGELGERLRHHGFEVRDDGRTLSFDDPWSNLLVARTAARASTSRHQRSRADAPSGVRRCRGRRAPSRGS